MAIVTGTNASDPELEGTASADTIFGLGGNDILIGLGGDDTLEGGAGTDEVFGSGGFDIASYRSSDAGVRIDLGFFHAEGGHAAGDHLYSIEGVIGSAYKDVLDGSNQRDVLQGDGGADSLFGYGGNDLLRGGSGNDELDGGVGADEMVGGAGADLVYYGLSDAAVRVDLGAGTGQGGDAEGDRLSGIEDVEGSARGDRLIGNDASNWLIGNAGDDVIFGGAGNDIITGGPGTDQLDGGAGFDTLDYSRTAFGLRVDLAADYDADDYPFGSIAGFERVIGTAFDDDLLADGGANGLVGGAGNDFLVGGLGRDELTGGAGADRFRFSFTTESGKTADTRDVVHDFRPGEDDHLDFSQMDASTSRDGDQDPTFIGGKAFTAEGQIRAFFEGDHTVLEVNTTGTAGAEMQVRLDHHVSLTASDFFFID